MSIPLTLRIGFFGGDAQALAVLERIVVEPAYHIVFVHPRWPDDPIAVDFAPRHGIPVMSERDINSPEGLAYVRSSGADLLVSVNAKQIFRREMLSLPRLGAINLHNGLLPRQRGGGGAYVGLINGEHNGATVHIVDSGVDSGPIILQQTFDLPPNPTMANVLVEAIRHSPEMVIKALHQLVEGTVAPVSQDQAPYYYVPSKPEWDELIDWARSTNAILTRLRARTPGPRGTYVHGGSLWRVAAFAEEPLLLAHDNVPGQILARRKDFGVLVKTGDTGFWITRIEPAEGGPSFTPSHRVGDVLRQNLDKDVFDLNRRLVALEQRISDSKT